MRATTIIMVAAGVFVIGRWSHNKPAVTLGSVASVFFLLIVIGMLDQGTTESIAKGFAWLILAVALLSDNSPILPVSKLVANTLNNKPLEPGS